MTSPLVLSIDQGTTGTTAMIVDFSLKDNPTILAQQTTNFKQIYPLKGYVEHDLEEIWDSVVGSINLVIAKIETDGFTTDDIKSIGITNQRETLCVFSKNTGKPICNAIVWQCKRSSDICTELKKKHFANEVIKRTGLVIDPYFTASKLSWLFANNKLAAELLVKNEAYWGTVDTFLIYRLTGCKNYVTEPSNASRTLLYDIKSAKWDTELVDFFSIPQSIKMPNVLDSVADFGQTVNLSEIPKLKPTKITAVLGDQQASLAGQGCFAKGDLKCTYGTGAFLLLNTKDEIKVSKHGLLTTIAWSINGKVDYAIEGSSFIAGAAMQFLRDQLNIIEDVSKSEIIATNVEAAPNIYFVPALAGLGAPYWRASARGAFLGMSRDTSKAQIIRAAIEGIAFQVSDLVRALNKDFESEVSTINVDGGACNNNLLLQLQSNYSNLEIIRPKYIETTALGVAFMAAFGVSIYSNLHELKKARVTAHVFKPSSKDQDAIKSQLSGWQKALQAISYFS